MSFVFLFFCLLFVDDWCCPRCAAGHALPPAGLAHAGASPRRFRRVFVSLLFLRLVALCVSLWVGGVPLAAFSPPPVSWFWVVWWGVSCLVLLHLASL